MSLDYGYIFSQIDKAKKKRKKWTQADTDAAMAKLAEEKEAREKILGIHSKGKPLSNEVKMAKIAELTEGFSGADLASVVNTAVSSVLQNFVSKYNPEEAKEHIKEAIVTMNDFESAVRKVKTSRDGRPVEKSPMSFMK